MIKAFIVVTVFLYPLIVLATKIKIVTHNQMGIWTHDPQDEKTYYSAIVKNYFDAVGNVDVIIFNFQELMELKVDKAFKQVNPFNKNKSNSKSTSDSKNSSNSKSTLDSKITSDSKNSSNSKSTSNSTDTANVSKNGNLLLTKVHARLLKYFKNDKYNCTYIIEYYMATIVCVDKTITDFKVKKYNESFFNGKLKLFSFVNGLFGQKGGMITSIMFGNKWILNTNVHLDSANSKDRQSQFKNLYEICETSEMVKEPNQRSIFIFAGDFNQRSTEAQKKKYEKDIIEKQIKPSTIFENKNEGEMKDTIIKDYDLDEKNIEFIPTYKIDDKKLRGKKIKFSEIKNSKNISGYYKDGKASYTDRILIDKKLNSFFYTIVDYTILDLDSVFSDHLPVVATITIENFQNNNNVGKRPRSKQVFKHAESKLII